MRLHPHELTSAAGRVQAEVPAFHGAYQRAIHLDHHPPGFILKCLFGGGRVYEVFHCLLCRWKSFRYLSLVFRTRPCEMVLLRLNFVFSAPVPRTYRTRKYTLSNGASPTLWHLYQEIS